jgi:hypothetical protein
VGRGARYQALAGSHCRPTNMKKQLLFALVVFMTGFYTTFVLMSLWNWFLAPALHTAGVSYWMMYGIQLIWDTLSARKLKDPLEQRKWDGLFIALEACLPNEKRAQVDEALEGTEKIVWLDLQRKVFGDTMGQTVVLALGCGVHAFLT